MEVISGRIEQAARKFLQSGRVNGIDTPALASACSEIIRKQSETSLKKALSLSNKFVRYTKNQDNETTYTALRACARINHLIGKYYDGEKLYLKARNLIKDNAHERASIDRALVDLYMYLGKLNESKRRAKLAIAAFSKLGANSDVAKTSVNYANVLHRQDKHREAEKLYHQAARHFEKAGDKLAIARCYYNRANTLVQLFELDKAETLYLQSEKIYEKHGHTIDANDARYGLAWLQMLKGDYHIALLNLSECEKVYQQAGHSRMTALCELDRAEVYLNLNLFSDALESSRRAEMIFRKIKIRYESAKSAFYRAKAAHALEMKSEATRSLKRAISGFQKEKNDGFLAAALLLNSQVSSESKIRKSSIEKARNKFNQSQLPLWEAICSVYLGGQSKYRNEALANLKKNHAVKHVPHLFAQWQTLNGDKFADEGKLTSAKNCWRMAADCLDRVRAQLPPVELRTNFGATELSPHSRLIVSESERSPLEAAVWSERFKTAGVWRPIGRIENQFSVRAKVEQSLVDLANRVSAYSHQITGIAGERGNLAPQSLGTITNLQKKVRQELAGIEKESKSSIEKKSDLGKQFKEESMSQPIVQFHVGKDDILAFVHQKGETILKRYPQGRAKLNGLLKQWRFLLENELLQKHLGQSSTIDEEHRLFEKLGEWLWKPLDLPSEGGRVVVLPEEELANVPWQAIRINGKALAERYSFVLTPSLRHYVHSKKIKVNSNNVKVFVGRSDDLPQVSKELNRITASTKQKVEIMNPSYRNQWSGDDSAELWHYSGHAYLRSDNPFYSYLALADGPLFAADFRLKNSRVNLVTLAACRSGEQVALSGQEATGLVRSILEMGARNVIAGHWPVADESTAEWMDRFYKDYFDGVNLDESSRNASLEVREKYPSAYHWAAFSVFGAGDRGVNYH